MTERLDALLDRLEELLGEVDRLGQDARQPVFELLDGIDELHRLGIQRLASAVDDADVTRARAADPVVEWLLSAYGVGADERAAAEAALDAVRPYVHSHGGHVEVVDVRDGRVRVRLAGACSGCSASAVTLRHGVEEALREAVPGFAAVVVDEDGTASQDVGGPDVAVELGPTRG